jgi:cytochrome b561
MAPAGYSRGQILLHWLSAAFILWALVTGFYVSGLGPASPLRGAVTALNLSLATLFIPVFALRVWLRLRHHRPVASSFAERLAAMVHTLIYVLTGIVLLSGLLMMDRPIPLFNLVTLPQPIVDTAWLQRFKTLHVLGDEGLGGLLALHVLAVIKHEASGRRVLKRMSFSG